MKKALVIGSLGFVGEYLIKELENSEIVCFGADIKKKCNNINNYYEMNLLNKYEIEKILVEVQPDYIVNLAAISSVKQSWLMPDVTFDINVKGIINLFEAIRSLQTNPRILLIGSSEQYGNIAHENPINENNELNALNPYGISKITQEKIAEMYIKTFDLDIVLVRAFNHIGPKQALGFAIPDFCNQIVEAEKKQKVTDIFVGNLTAKRDFTDVRDIVRAYRFLLEKGKNGEIYNVGSGNAHSLEYMLEFLVDKSVCDFNIVIDKDKFRPVDTPVIICDNSKIRRETGWMPEIEIEETLIDVLNYWRNVRRMN